MQNNFFIFLKPSSFFTFFLFLYLFLFPIDSFAVSGEFFKKGQSIEVIGDSVTYDAEKKTYDASGKVIVTQGLITLKADTVIVDMTLGLALASGNVEVSNLAGDYIRASVLSIDMDKNTAVALKARLFYKEGTISIWSEELKKTGLKVFDSSSTTATACECEEGEPAYSFPKKSPPWSIYSSSSHIEIENYFSAWNAIFYIKKVPVFYLPYISFPINTKRRSGFLSPQLGFSKAKGVKISNSFFWAISRSQDMTFYLDVETKRGLGSGLEYRYVQTEDSYGELYGYHYREDDLERIREFRSNPDLLYDNLGRPKTATEDRWNLNFFHREELGLGLTLKADIKLVSDDEYFLDFSKKNSERSKESLESTVLLTGSWGRYNLTIQARYFDNLLLDDDRVVLQRYPEVLFAALSREIFKTPLYFSFDSSIINFQHSGVFEEGVRADFRPRFSLPLKLAKWLEFIPYFQPWHTTYRLEDVLPSSSDHHYLNRSTYQTGADLKTSLLSYFGASPSPSRLRLTLRPKLSYLYIPNENQSSLPFFDSLDMVLPESTLTVSLNSTLSKKLDTGKRHEYLYLNLFQSYDIREARREIFLSTDKVRPYSDIEGDLVLRPTPWLKLATRGTFNHYDRWFESSDASLLASDKRGDSLSFIYRDVRGVGRFKETRVKIVMTDSLTLSYKERYALLEDDLVEETVILKYTHQCYSVALQYSKFIEEEIFYLTFNLKNLGE